MDRGTRIVSVLGYIVLTKFGPDWWRDDWDGEVHRTFRAAVFALQDARLVDPSAILVACEPVQTEGADSDDSADDRTRPLRPKATP
jgi:hypothetical protein